MPPQWAKVAADLDSNPKVRRAGRNGREVFLFVLRRVSQLDMPGSVPVVNIEPWYLADQLMMSEAEAEDGVKRAIASKLLTIEGDKVVVVGWDDEWGKRPLTEAERQEKRRSRTKDMPSLSVTKSHDTNVTDRDMSREVTEPENPKVTCPDSHALDKSRVDKSREEENMGRGGSSPPGPPQDSNRSDQPEPEASGSSPTPKPSRRKKNATPLAADWVPRPEELELGERELGLAPAQIASEAAKLRDWAVAKGEAKVDWDAAFRGWLRRAAELRDRERPKGFGGARAGPSSFASDPRYGRIEPHPPESYPDGEVKI